MDRYEEVLINRVAEAICNADNNISLDTWDRCGRADSRQIQAHGRGRVGRVADHRPDTTQHHVSTQIQRMIYRLGDL